MDEAMHRFFQEAMPDVLEEARREGYKIGFKEGYKIGFKEGRKIGKTKAIVSLFQDGIINETVAAEELGLSIEEFRKLAPEYPKA